MIQLVTASKPASEWVDPDDAPEWADEMFAMPSSRSAASSPGPGPAS